MRRETEIQKQEIHSSTSRELDYCRLSKFYQWCTDKNLSNSEYVNHSQWGVKDWIYGFVIILFVVSWQKSIPWFRERRLTEMKILFQSFLKFSGIDPYPSNTACSFANGTCVNCSSKGKEKEGNNCVNKMD